MKLAGGLEFVSKRLNVGSSTLYTYFRELQSPTVRLSLKIAEISQTRPEWLLFGIPPEREGDDSGDWETHTGKPPVEYLPLYDITVSAGNGVEPLEGEPEKTVAFRADWLRSRFDSINNLALVRIEGDSMLPELKPNDVMLVDRSQREPRDGFFVVQIGRQLLVKRVQRTGADKVKLLSANPAYAPIDVDLREQKDEFGILGRGVWIGRNI